MDFLFFVHFCFNTMCFSSLIYNHKWFGQGVKNKSTGTFSVTRFLRSIISSGVMKTSSFNRFKPRLG